MISPKPRLAKPATTDQRKGDAFVGRRRELDSINGSLLAAAGGAGRLEIVSGPPGIGKTRLTQEVSAIAYGHGFHVFRGGCWEGEGAPSYWPWAQVIRSLEPERTVGREIDLGHLLNLAEATTSVPGSDMAPPAKDAQQERFLLFDRFCQLLAVTAAVRPTLVIIDDVQFADTGSLLLLQFLTERLARLPIALLVTSREPLCDLTASTTRHPWVRHRVLRGLSRTDARALLATATLRAPKRSVFDRLMQLTEGNPYFLKELGQLLAEGDAGLTGNGSVVWPASLLVAALQPFDRLTVSCRALLQAASVIGREFDAELTADAAHVPVREALALLDEAVERRVVTALGGGRYQFRHALIREAVHDQLHPSDRTTLHESTALALERTLKAGVAVSAATLAHHFTKALPLTQRRQAAHYTNAAGQAAYGAFAYEEAVLQFRRAQELSGTSVSDLESCDLLLRLAAAEAGAGEWARSRRTFEDAAALARRIGCSERFAHAALGFKGMMFGTIPVDIDATNLLEEALQRLGKGSSQLRLRLYAALSRALYFASDTDRATAYSSLARQLPTPIDDDRLSAELTETHLLAHWRPDTQHTLRDDAQILLALSTRLRDPLLLFRARVYRYVHYLNTGASQDAAQELKAAEHLASVAQHPRSRWQIALLKAALATARGQAHVARQLSSRARDLGRRVHDSSPALHDLAQLFQLARLTKDYSAIISVAAQYNDSYPSNFGYFAARALLYAELERFDDCRDSLKHFTDHRFSNVPANNFQLFTLAILSEAVTACGHAEWAQSLYSLLLPHKDIYIVGGWGTVIDGSVEHFLALLASCMNDHDLATRHFEAALHANHRIEAAPILARTQLRFAQILASATDSQRRDRGYELAKSAQRTYSALRLHHLATESEEVAALCGQTPAPARDQALCASLNSFQRTGDIWNISYDGRQTSVRHILGFTYIAAILNASGEQLHVLDLIDTSRHQEAALEGIQISFSADTAARRAYKQRLRELAEELVEASGNNDTGRAERLHAERQMILTEVAYSYGVGGRPRHTRSPAERARVSIRNRITSALQALETCHPEAHRHLSRSIFTGTFCRYLPSSPTNWTVKITKGIP